MRLDRIYTPGPLVEGTEVELTPSGAAHVSRVLRLRSGDSIGVFDGVGNEFHAVLTAVKGARVIVRIGAAASSASESPLRIELAQGISRGERMDWVVQKATELGVASLAPVVTTRSVVKLDAQQAEKKREHWRGIAIGACEQCGRARLPEIGTPLSLRAYLNAPVGDSTRLVLDPNATQSLAAFDLSSGKVVLLVGPEGGLDAEELTLAQGNGFVAVRFGPRILRTETAAIAALAVLQGKWGDLA